MPSPTQSLQEPPAYQTPHRAPPHHGQVLSHHAAHMRAAPVPPPSQDEVQTLTSFQGPWRPTFRPPALFLDVLCELKTQAILKFCTFPLQYLKCPAPYFCLASRPRFRTEVHFLEPRRPSWPTHWSVSVPLFPQSQPFPCTGIVTANLYLHWPKSSQYRARSLLPDRLPWVRTQWISRPDHTL